jgi:hypothetical protein
MTNGFIAAKQACRIISLQLRELSVNQKECARPVVALSAEFADLYQIFKY